MQRVGQGGVIRLDANYVDGTGARVDPADPRVAIYDSTGAQRVAPTAPARDGVGAFHHDYAVPAGAPLGIWRAEWTGTINNAITAPANDFFEVAAAGEIVFAQSGMPTPAELGLVANRAIAADDARATLLISLALGACQAYTRQQLVAVEDDLAAVRGTGDEDLWLPQRPVRAIASVAIDGTALPVTAYDFDTTGRLARSVGRWPSGVEIAVTYSHGFVTLPDDLRGVILSAALRALNNPDNVAQESIEGYSVSYGTTGGIALTDDERAALGKYRVRAASVKVEPAARAARSVEVA